MADLKPRALDVSYDDETDVLHVTFGSGEPSYVKNMDDFFLMELGIYSQLPTGFQLVGPRKKGIKSFTMAMRAFKRREPLMERQYRQSMRTREGLIREAFRQAERTLHKG